MTKSWFATGSSLWMCWEGGELCPGRCVPAESPALGSLLPTQHVWLEGKAFFSSSSSSSLSGTNCTLEALMTTWCSLQELPQKAEPENSTKGITPSLFLRLFLSTLGSFTTDESVLPSWAGGQRARILRNTQCLERLCWPGHF